MYNLKFESFTTRKTMFLNFENDIIIRRVEGATGTTVSLGLSQGYQQIGQSVLSATVGGMTLNISGYILDKNTLKKQELLQAFAPFTTGRLWWEDKFFVDVQIKDSPTISQEEHSSFSFRLFSPSPFWSSKTKSSTVSGITSPKFSFPINYATTHEFGSKNMAEKYVVVNQGMVDTAFELEISGTEQIVNPRIFSETSGEVLQFIGSVEVGEILKLTQTTKNILVTKIHVDGSETNEFSMLDDESSFFRLKVGDNVLKNEADEGESGMITQVSFYPLYSGVLANGV